MKKKEKITKNSTLADVLSTARAEEILGKHGVPCVTCPMAAMEMEKLQIGDICQMYNVDLKALLKDLNKKG